MWLEGYLKDHKKRLLEEKVLKYKCNDCDKAFTIISHWSSLLMHTNKIQNSNINVKHVIMLLLKLHILHCIKELFMRAYGILAIFVEKNLHKKLM